MSSGADEHLPARTGGDPADIPDLGDPGGPAGLGGFPGLGGGDLSALMAQAQQMQQQQGRPAGPSLSEILGSSSGPEANVGKKGGSTFDTLNGNVLTR